MRNRTNFFRAKHDFKMRSKRSEVKNCLSSKNVNLCLLDCTKGKRRLGECEIVQIFFGQIMKMRSKRKTAYQVKMSIFVYLTL